MNGNGASKVKNNRRVYLLSVSDGEKLVRMIPELCHAVTSELKKTNTDLTVRYHFIGNIFSESALLAVTSSNPIIYEEEILFTARVMSGVLRLKLKEVNEESLEAHFGEYLRIPACTVKVKKSGYAKSGRPLEIFVFDIENQRVKPEMAAGFERNALLSGLILKSSSVSVSYLNNHFGNLGEATLYTSGRTQKTYLCPASIEIYDASYVGDDFRTFLYSGLGQQSGYGIGGVIINSIGEE